jgi:hypothetical protein
MSEESPNVTSELSEDGPSSKPPGLSEDSLCSNLPDLSADSKTPELIDSKTPELTALELPVDSSPLTIVPLKKKQRKKTFWVKFWWIPVTFLIPFAVFYEYMGSYARLNMAGSFRSGAIGLAVAGLIYGLWQIDQRLGPGDKPSPSGSDKKALHVDPLIGALGILLWFGWVSAAHIMIVAHDEVTAMAAMADR